MQSIRVIAILVSLLLIIAPRESKSANPVAWNIDIFTTGQDVFWTSPTAITLGLAEYDWSYQITKLSATVALFGEQDLLERLGDRAIGSGTATTLPVVLLDEVLNDSTTGSKANLHIEVDANGFGKASGTEIVLGSVLGLPIQRVNLEATVSVIGIPTGDYNRDGAVDAADYAIWKGDFGSTTLLAADGNKNNVVDAADYTLWRDNLNANAAGLTGAGAAVPEPNTAFMALAILALGGTRRSLCRV